MPPSARDQDRCRKILEFWHGVEFFLPYDLQSLVLDADPNRQKSSVQLWSANELRALGAGSGNLWQVAHLPAGKKIASFALFLGKFDRSRLGAAARLLSDKTLSAAATVDEIERGAAEGATCFALIRADAHAVPDLAEISVSTLPWALGQLAQGGIAGLRFDRYEAAVQTLKDRLQRFKSRRGCPAGGEAGINPPLTGEEICELLGVFYEWAGFEPNAGDDTAIVVQAHLVEDKDKPKKASEPVAAHSMPESEETTPGDSDEADIEAPGEEVDTVRIEILNSFYGADIEDILRQPELIAGALLAYLCPGNPSKRIDLASPAGLGFTEQALHPRHLPSARWFGEPMHALSLLQQLAVNRGLANDSLFSVNGPPGTGKTTLLRDIMAEIITSRAKILAGLRRARDAFEGSIGVDFERADASRVARLIPGLTGHEMVVASSNNAAVDNISRDLPKPAALGSPKGYWRGKTEGRPSYLQEVAHKIAAQTGDNEFKALDDKDIPWGLISCALGNKRNRRAFAQGFGSSSKAWAEKPPQHYDPSRHKSIWQWRETGSSLSFDDAKASFRAALEEVERRQHALSSHADLYRRQPLQTARLAEAEQVLRVATAALAEQHEALDHGQQALDACERDIGELQAIGSRLGQARPPLLQRLVKRGQNQALDQQMRDNQREQANTLQQRRALRIRRDAAQASFEIAQARQHHEAQALEQIRAEQVQDEARLKAGELAFPGAAFPADPAMLADDSWQVDGIWYDEALNQARAELFAAALNLHQAWLAEVLRKGGGFGGNVVALCNLLEGKRLAGSDQPGKELLLWQSLFMIVPVVSTTFASFKRQFGGLAAGSIGWLFVDEAGQTVPQAAVGALWRTRRAIMVGDPRQIEPVFTVPDKLIGALAASYGLAEGSGVEPHRVSAQNLGDAGNPLGTRIPGGQPGQEIWVGSPLRVHRRCADPMFTLANAIAYEDGMVFGQGSRQPPAEAIDLGPSAWVDISGPAMDRQVVREQIDLVAQALHALSSGLGKLPPLYIISPFKRIRQALQERLRERDWWQAQAGSTGFVPNTGALHKWCSEQIGTVHTFQGKEQDIVWMVLGCDETTMGAIDWACAKPNLLNVALTRARHRFFLVGDRALWGSRTYFSQARDGLTPISGDAFIARCRAARPASDNGDP